MRVRFVFSLHELPWTCLEMPGSNSGGLELDPWSVSGVIIRWQHQRCKGILWSFYPPAGWSPQKKWMEKKDNGRVFEGILSYFFLVLGAVYNGLGFFLKH